MIYLTNQLFNYLRSMRFLLLIILLASIAATVVPCCAFDDCKDELTSAAVPGKKEQKGNCSPLSICAGCSIAIAINKTVKFDTPQPAQIVFADNYTSAPLSSYTSSFWQPPRSNG